ncbi:aromatic amino acid exporter YddG [Chelatococcus asaccharovorans]|uniref:EamA domain-containing membrane protein RarD n=1 Tax=Chelatococcus asaccharovorans TaxID=28210 RepID=A0A2V3UID6_9HYPH|nr:EamA family transporter [Chelatococcus asaccharovorans]MBS7706421.1 EamA family transporter [Chelatococcus asaccharovorans]PXW64936.1 EamA domain-containing membrane protein RarD [Chelatococcus asaccharovorans]
MVVLTGATRVGLGAIALWSLLAALTAASGKVPPFQLAAMTFALGGLLGCASWIVKPAGVAALRQPWRVWLVGVSGLFGYHALYFAALRIAPPAEAGLINYLWPLLIVLFAALLPGEKLRPAQILGAIFGFAGVLVLIFSKQDLSFSGAYVPGYLAALGAAVIWAIYSLLSRALGTVPTDAVAGFCLVTSVLSALCHIAFEETVWPAFWWQWLAIVVLGVGPLGAAFYCWDIGVKRGDIGFLGVAAYATPVISTLLLVVFGFAEATISLAVACALIVAGAFIASLATSRGRPSRSPQS